MSFVKACFHLARFFMSTHLNTLRTYWDSRHCRSDILWWQQFLPLYSVIPLIKMSPWIDHSWHLSTEATNTGAGGYFSEQLFHMPFLEPIPHHFSHNINVLELLSIMIALKSYPARNALWVFFRYPHPCWNMICTIMIRYKISSLTILFKLPDEVCVIR